MTVHELSRTDARRIAVRGQILDAARPTVLLDVVRHKGPRQRGVHVLVHGTELP